MVNTFGANLTSASSIFMGSAGVCDKNRCIRAALPHALLGKLLRESACRSGSLLYTCPGALMSCLEFLIRLQGEGWSER